MVDEIQLLFLKWVFLQD